jgi:hypothetical protein
MLLARFVPLLQVTFFALLEDFYLGRRAVKDWDKTLRITGVILIMWYQSPVLIMVQFGAREYCFGCLILVSYSDCSHGLSIADRRHFFDPISARSI